MRKTQLAFLSFAAAVLMLVGALKLLNWIPTVAQKEILHSYKDIEEAKAELSLRDVLIPSYFPEKLRWPPSAILAQGKPFPAVIMEFFEAGNRETALVITQTASDAFPAHGKIRFEKVAERVNYSLRGRDAALEVGTCDDGDPCSSISWNERGNHVRVTARSSPIELIRVAESMLR
jgi:hypothetical protein